MTDTNAGSSTDRGFTALNGVIGSKKQCDKERQIILDENLVNEIQDQLLNKIPKYPQPPSKGGVTEEIHGITVHDPWRALEVTESKETQTFMKEQNECSFEFLHSPLRETLENSVKQAFEYTRTSCPMLQGDGFYYWLFNPGEAARDLMVRSRCLDKHFGKSPFEKDGPEMFFDPEKLPNSSSLTYYSWSPSGKYFCAILQNSGSDWQSIRVLDTKTLQLVGDTLVQLKFNFGVCWVDDFGFIYKRILDLPTTDDKNNVEQYRDDADGQFGLFFYSLYGKQKEDVNIWKGDGKEEYSFFAEKPFLCSATANGRKWLFFTIYRNTNPDCEAFMIEITHLCSKESFSSSELERLCSYEKRWITKGFQGDMIYVGTTTNDRSLFLSKTDGCNLGRIISVSSNSLDATKPNEKVVIDVLVPENSNGYILEKARLVEDDLLVLIYLRNVCAFMVFVDAKTGKPLGWSDPEGTTGRVEVNDAIVHKEEPLLPECSSISSITARADCKTFYMSIETWIEPPYILQGSYEKDEKKVYLERMTKSIVNEEEDLQNEILSRQVFYSSRDGIEIPMFLCHARSLRPDTPHRALIHAYGGFARPLLPHYDPLFIAFVRELDGIVAIPGVRGGGEYGEAWHKQGMGKNRINSFDDLAFAAKYLHENKLSNPSFTSIYGSSNGGTLMMASVNRNPQLFGACMADAGISDLIRFPLFNIGRIWQAEYGSPNDPKMFPFLFKISPLHNVIQDPNVQLPALFITHGYNDSRVIPGNSLKYLAEVQNRKRENANPILGKIYWNTGHEAGNRSTKERVEEAIDRLVFCLTFLKDDHAT